MGIVNIVSEKITLPVGDLLTGNSVAKDLDFLMQSQWWPRVEIKKYQEKKLQDLIRHCVSTVPFYRDLFRENDLQVDSIKTITDLKKLPVLKKSRIKKEGLERFKSSSVGPKEIIQSASSGSTGEPLFYVRTRKAYSFNLATQLRGWYWMGFRLGDRYVKLSQNPRKDPIKRLQDRFSNNQYLAINPLEDKNFEYVLGQIEKFKPEYIRCYPDPLLFLARFKKKHPEFSHVPKAIATTGNTLFPETRKEIEDSFCCKIFDAYSCEGNSTVFECPSHNGYHSAGEYGITEIIDENGYPVTEGIGRLISTDLWNYAHPFIRYDTQDYVEVDSSPCSCGRNLLKIKRIIGRDNDVLEMESGRKFIVHNFTGFFQTDTPEIKRSVDQFQIVKRKDRVIFKLVVNQNYCENVKLYIKNFWERELRAPVYIEIVNNIPLTTSGKRKFIIDEGNSG
jgi:phenylacetate-CoA ligase